MFKATLALACAGILAAQTLDQNPLGNTGRPMRVAYQCTAAETQAAGIGCSEQDPCPVYLELSNVDAVDHKVFATGNIHTPMATLDSILLASIDGGKTWTEPHPRIRSAGLDQVQFVDAEHGWISGANLQTAPRDPFFLITTDGGKSWRQQSIFEETRVAAIESFRFDSPANGTAWIDATLDNGMHETYATHDGGETWKLEPGAEREKARSTAGWRLRADATTHSYVIEQSEDNRWQKVASFLVNIASCKE
jgi:BNR/Asp-box repeat